MASTWESFEFHCALLVEGSVRANHFPNSTDGFKRLHRWLKNRHIERVHACLEATGGWSEELGTDLHAQGHVVSIVNPLAIKSFGQSELSRTKTDKADAALIARFCAAMHPGLWEPPSPLQQRLRRLARRRTALDEMRVQESNRLGAPGSADVRESIETTIGFLEQQIAEVNEQIRSLIHNDPTMRGHRDLLTSIPGIGERVAVTILGELPQITEFRNAKALAAFVGLCPESFDPGAPSRLRGFPRSAMLTFAGCSSCRRSRRCAAIPFSRPSQRGSANGVSEASKLSWRSCGACWSSPMEF